MVVLYDRFNLPDDIFEVIFATKQQEIVAKMLIDYMKQEGEEIGKTEMSLFATKLHDGELVGEIDDPQYRGKMVKISYNKRQFYDRILTPMKSMGLIDYDLYRKKYRISKKFNQDMMRIGLMWIQEVDKKPYSFVNTGEKKDSKKK
ncbi:hypothetical protein HOD20_08505 [archaeon]|jgi:hypothetical protein|nr:hypothetical protein [archaeon]MBT4352550.1 hypothetical protein [archaeon]MBT4648571.1 hypothetical protein [archaeon]MBT6821426.1 hypothetical protein [archaeon]MBT7393021.1 hypothetical protein [archaeon]